MQFYKIFSVDQKGGLYFNNTSSNQNYDEALSLYSRMHETIQQKSSKKRAITHVHLQKWFNRIIFKELQQL